MINQTFTCFFIFNGKKEKNNWNNIFLSDQDNIDWCTFVHLSITDEHMCTKKKKGDKCHGSFTIESNEIKLSYLFRLLKVHRALSNFVVEYKKIVFLDIYEAIDGLHQQAGCDMTLILSKHFTDCLPIGTAIYFHLILMYFKKFVKYLIYWNRINVYMKRKENEKWLFFFLLKRIIKFFLPWLTWWMFVSCQQSKTVIWISFFHIARSLCWHK